MSSGDGDTDNDSFDHDHDCDDLVNEDPSDTDTAMMVTKTMDYNKYSLSSIS